MNEATTPETSTRFTGAILLRDFSYGTHDMKYDGRGDAILKDGRVISIPVNIPVGRRALEEAVATGARRGRLGQWEWSHYGGAY